MRHYEFAQTTIDNDCSGISDPVIWKFCEDSNAYATEEAMQADYNKMYDDSINEPVNRECDFRGCYDAP